MSSRQRTNRRRGSRPALPRFFPAVAAAAFIGATLVLLFRAPDSLWYLRRFPLDDGPGFRLSFIGGCLSGVTALALAVWGALRVSRRRQSRHGNSWSPVTTPWAEVTRRL